TWLSSLGYNSGRALSYMLAGALVAGIISQFATHNSAFSFFLSFLSGILMLLVGVYIMRLAATLQCLEKLGKSLI
ncbi:sulfite exporter TauE/SafE family protein, partial [Pseudoalteromonas sp. S1688]|uniref:urease accessory protein UreH domain-containing protein n=1 Tax=Pseudoalteromonas sp. S1688 TaxID=579511 RepID=UPI00110BE271